MMQQSPRLYASPHAQSLRVLRCPLGGESSLGWPGGRVSAPTFSHIVWLRCPSRGRKSPWGVPAGIWPAPTLAHFVWLRRPTRG